MKIKIIKAQDYIFLKKEININVKLNKTIIKINFKDDLVFENVFFLKKNNQLYIYNTNYNKKFFIPEGYILFSSLKEDGIFVFKNPNGYYNVIIKKENILQNDFIIKELDDFVKHSLTYEYSLPIEIKDYNLAIKEGLKKVSYIDLLKLSGLTYLDLNKLKNIVLNLSFPLLLSVILTYISLLGFYFFYNKNKKNLENDYHLLQKKTNSLDLKVNLIKYLNNEILFIQKYKNPFVLELGNLIAKVVKDVKGRLSYLKIDYNNKFIVFYIDANNSTIILEKLARIKYIKNLRIVSEIKLFKGIKRYRFEGIIK